MTRLFQFLLQVLSMFDKLSQEEVSKELNQRLSWYCTSEVYNYKKTCTTELGISHRNKVFLGFLEPRLSFSTIFLRE